MGKKATYRVMYKFWLDQFRPDEFELMMFIEQLKRERGFAKAIRDGLRLVMSLRRGDTSVLYELYPLLRVGQVATGIPTASAALPSAAIKHLPAPQPSPSTSISITTHDQPKLGGFARSVAKLKTQ